MEHHSLRRQHEHLEPGGRRRRHPLGLDGINGIARWNGTAFESTDISTALPPGTALRALTAVPGTTTLWAVGQTSTSSVAITNG